MTVPAWMLEAPRVKLAASTITQFEVAWTRRDLSLLPQDVPRWLLLEWLTRQGWLLHGSSRPDIERFEPRAAVDLSADAFSNQRAVYATSDGLWAMMYALRDRAVVQRMVNAALHLRTPAGEWSTPRYFLSLAPREGLAVPDAGRALLRPGSVYVLPPESFVPMPPYAWPGLGGVKEPQWTSAAPVRPLWRIPVQPDDFPLPVRQHDAETVDARCEADPWAFPWLE